MRIQHNIMAMNAYRNYNTNVAAMKSNLEKLSSGYKINRAGDDAAGLAISEKMRAQITGLNAAQKNVKDGISLVQTAEGAMQEVQDMLNRMVYLATQSANGTYDDDVDRNNLQKELDQLRSEIDRISDSSNFNGIKLLDGSKDAGGVTTSTAGAFQVQATGVTVSAGNIGLPTVGETLGTNTVLHKDGATAGTKNEFSVELHNLETTNATGSSITIKIGTDEFKLDAADTGSAGTKMDAAAIATAFKEGKFKVGGAAMTAGKATVDGTEYDVTAKDGKITFSTTADLAAGKTIPKEVTVTGAGGAAVAANPGTAAKVTAAVTLDDGSGATPTLANGDTIQFTSATGGLSMTFTYDGTKWESADTAPTGYTATFDGTSFKMEAAAVGSKGTTSPFGAITATANINNGGTAGSTATAGTPAWTDGTAATAAQPAGSNPLTGDYNKSTTDILTKGTATSDRLASTKFALTDDMVAEGSTLTIGNDTYTFTKDASKAGETGYVVYNEGDTLTKIAEKLTDAAAGNTTYTVGHDGTNITVTEVEDQANFDLTTAAGIEKSLGFTKATTSASAPDKALTFQIGDTADSYNQLKVSIGDIHTKALGIDGISIKTQSSAAEAVQKIKDAINRVSSIRGDLGATQNRLEHTQNNLSVMTENIQDAESNIRDTDVAEEMMAYTKNNILIQAAQAMLAQANQVPQGVLQLLQ